jgi:hypothetical protein
MRRVIVAMAMLLAVVGSGSALPLAVTAGPVHHEALDCSTELQAVCHAVGVVICRSGCG